MKPLRTNRFLAFLRRSLGIVTLSLIPCASYAATATKAGTGTDLTLLKQAN